MQCTRVLNSAKGMLGRDGGLPRAHLPKRACRRSASPGLTPISATPGSFSPHALARIPNTLTRTMVGSTLYEKTTPALLCQAWSCCSRFCWAATCWDAKWGLENPPVTRRTPCNPPRTAPPAPSGPAFEKGGAFYCQKPPRPLFPMRFPLPSLAPSPFRKAHLASCRF